MQDLWMYLTVPVQLQGVIRGCRLSWQKRHWLGAIAYYSMGGYCLGVLSSVLNLLNGAADALLYRRKMLEHLPELVHLLHVF